MSKQGQLIAVAEDQDGKSPRIVTETEPFPISLFDGEGNPISSLSGAIDIHDADVHARPLNLNVLRCTGTVTNPATNLAVGTYSFGVGSGDGAGFPVGATITFTEAGIVETVVYTVTIQSTDTLTLDMPIGAAYTTAAVIENCVIDMSSVAGSLASPQIYKIAPPVGQIWHMYRFLISIVHDAAADDSKFGSESALANGVILRRAIGGGGFANFTNWKSNSDMAGDMFNVEYTDKSGNGKYGTRGRASIKVGSGAIIKLDGDAGDEVQLVVQDDITALVSYRIKFQGHIEGE